MGTDPRGSPGPDASRVVELVAQLKRNQQLSRLYGPGHELLLQVERELFAKLTQYLEAEAHLPLTIAQEGLFFGEKRVFEDERREESLTRALFADGVEGIELTRGLEPAELSSLLEMWFGAVGNTLPPEHTFSTLAWERTFEHVVFSFRPGLAEGGKEEGRATVERREELEAAILGRTEIPPARRRVDAEALASLDSVKAFRGLRLEDLERVSAVERAHGLEATRTDRGAVIAELSTDRRTAGERALVALWGATTFAPPTERARILGLAGPIVRTMLDEGDARHVARAITRIVQSAPPDMDSQTHLQEFLGFLCEKEVFSALVRRLDARESASDARTILLQLPSAAADLLLDAAEGASKATAAQLGALFAAKLPDPPTLAMWMLVRGDAAAAVVFDLGDRLSPEHLDMALRTALIHDVPDVRARALRFIPTASAPQFRSLVFTLLEDPSPEVSERVLRALVRARDPEVVPALVERLEAPGSTPETVRSAIRALGTIGGDAAVDGLGRVLRSFRSREDKRAAAFALAASQNPRAIALLQAEAGRFFGDRAVKEACRDALKRAENKAPRGEEGV